MNSEVAQRFWDNSPKTAKGRSLSYDGKGKLFSYGTVILQRVGNYVLGNGTSYSHTTSTHQSIAKVYNADLILYNVPIGRWDLLAFAYHQYEVLGRILEATK